jgi:photosynthetic reaction center cytochrome c subunit
MTRALAGLARVALLAFPLTAAAQVPQRFENLKVLPTDIPRDTLIQIMRGFSFALGVRCEHCHVQAKEDTAQRIVFKSDDKKEKRTARFMMRMVHDLNVNTLAQLPDRSNPPVRVQCVTCHRGSPVPQPLDVVLEQTIAEFGVDSAIARYRRLRTETMHLGRYNFGEWSTNELARRLGEQGKTAEAIAMLEMNQEFYPRSAAIDLMIAQLHERRGERDKAISRYRAGLVKEPENRLARRRLTELGAQE